MGQREHANVYTNRSIVYCIDNIQMCTLIGSTENIQITTRTGFIESIQMCALTGSTENIQITTLTGFIENIQMCALGDSKDNNRKLPHTIINILQSVLHSKLVVTVFYC